jgi:branched-chain amino acid transport system ATP-binding protein
MAERPMLELRNVSAAYGPIRALREVSIRVPAGGITAVIGVNGAGKTTALTVMAGLMAATEGEIAFDGADCDLRGRPVIRPGIGFSPEGRRLFGEMSVADNLRVGAFTVRDKRKAAAGLERVYRLFPRLEERKAQKAGTLSGGEQQMAAIGRALMVEPKLLLLDEPTLGLAPMVVSQVTDMVGRIRDEGTSIVLVEQNAGVALRVADFAYVLDNGRVALEGSARELRDSELIRAAYLTREAAPSTRTPRA